MKKALSVLVAITMVFTMVQAGVVFVSADQNGDFTFTVSGGVATLTGYTGAGGNVVIPTSLNGFNVTALGNRAFYSITTLTSVTIPRYVTTIGEQVFSGCSALTEILVNANNTSFSSAGGVLYGYSQTAIVAYPGGKSGAFGVFVPEIRPFAFEGCAGLTEISFYGVTTIGDFAFRKCTALTSVTIPTSVQYMGFNVFIECSSLLNIGVDEPNSNFFAWNGILFGIPGNKLLCYPARLPGLAYIPFWVPEIASYAFFNCEYVTSVAINEGVSIIGDAAFFGCTGLTTLNLPSTITQIKTSAFESCTGLTSIYIPANVGVVSDSAFKDCSDLSMAFFGGNAPDSFGSYVFENSAVGFKVYYLSTNSGFSNPWYGYETQAFEPSISQTPTSPTNGDVTVTITYPAIADVWEYKIGDGAWTEYISSITMTENGDVYARCATAEGVSSPEVLFSVTNIDRIAPATPTLTAAPNQPTDEKVIVTVEYPGDAGHRQVKIGDGEWDKYLVPVELKENDTVYARCFDEAGNESPTGSIVINFIGFYDYEYTVYGSETVITGYNGAGGDVVIPATLGGCPVTAIDDSAFSGCATLTSVVIPATVLSIGAEAFYRCENLAAVALPAGLIKIYASAFSGCIFLTGITIPTGVIQIDDTAFYGCEALDWAYFTGEAPAMGNAGFDACAEGFFVYYLDAHGFGDPWYYKAIPFEPSLTAAPTAPTNGNVTVTIVYPAPADIKEYKIGAGSWDVYTVPVVMTENATIYARCSGALGDTCSPVSLAVTNIDKISPDDPVLSVSPEYETTGYVTVTISFPADASVKQYALDSAGEAWTPYTGPIVLWANDIVYARCFDAVGNGSKSSLTVDNIITIAEGIIEKRGSTTVIDRKNNYIYGLKPSLSQDEFMHDYIEMAGNVKIYFYPKSEILGTGTRVDVYNEAEELIATYFIVIFGDMNGDGNVDSMDAGAAIDYENHRLNLDPPFDEIMPFAGDVNGDGEVDGIDAGIIVDAENFLVTINQIGNF